jgi:hypothetical protein
LAARARSCPANGGNLPGRTFDLRLEVRDACRVRAMEQACQTRAGRKRRGAGGRIGRTRLRSGRFGRGSRRTRCGRAQPIRWRALRQLVLRFWNGSSVRWIRTARCRRMSVLAGRSTRGERISWRWRLGLPRCDDGGGDLGRPRSCRVEWIGAPPGGACLLCSMRDLGVERCRAGVARSGMPRCRSPERACHAGGGGMPPTCRHARGVRSVYAAVRSAGLAGLPDCAWRASAMRARAQRGLMLQAAASCLPVIGVPRLAESR